MKLIYRMNAKKTIFLLVPLIIVAALIWYWGPLLIVAKHAPLIDPQKRLVLILTLCLAWLLKFLFLDQIKPITTNAQDLTHMLHALRGRFLGALRFLKKTIIDKHGYSTPLNKLPWYLLIGPPGAGKTTLLAFSNINYILSKQFKHEGEDKDITASSVCDWWVTRDLVLVDVPGCYTFSPPQDHILEANEEKESIAPSKPHLHLSLWKSLLHLLTKYRQKNNIGAVIVAFQLPELTKQSRQQQTLWFQEMKERLIDVWGKFGKLPVYFIITKCDLLPGFSEFFTDIGSDELTQPWGIPLSARKEHETLLEAFTQRFNALIKRLNKQLIWRLHLEKNAELRPLIKDFPLQLEFLKETLSYLIKMLLAANPNLDLEGIYLTSTTQENHSSSASTLFHHDLPTELQISSSSPFITRAYFIKHFISNILPHTSQHLIQRLHQKSLRLPRLAYSLGFTLLLICTLWFGKDFQRGLLQISQIQHYLTQYQIYLQQNNTQDPSILSINSALPLLNTLVTATQPEVYASRFQQIEAYYSQKSQQTTVAIYEKALQTLLMPKIRNEFEKYLQTADDNKNPEQLYGALKAYLMLRHTDAKISNPLRVEYILQTLKEISPLLKKHIVNKDLIQHIQNAVQMKQANTLDKKLIIQTRRKLNALPAKDLAYILLTQMDNNNQETAINLGTNIGTPPALVSKGTITIIPHMFTALAFNIIKDEIPLAAEGAVKGNEILGKKFISLDADVSNTALINPLAEQLGKSYLTHYIDIWESLVDNISLNPPKTLAETDILILNLISSHSPLLQLLQTIHDNTNFEPILSNSYKLQALNTLFNQTQTKQADSLYQIFVDLQQLHLFIQQASNTRVAAKDKIEDPSPRIRTTAEKYPEPIKNWLLALVAHTQNQLQADFKLGEGSEHKAVLVQPSSVPPPPIGTPTLKPTQKIVQSPLKNVERPSGLSADVLKKKIVSPNQPITEPSLIK